MTNQSGGPSSDAFGVVLRDPVMLRHANRLILLARAAASPCNSLYFIIFDEGAAVELGAARAWNGWYRFDFDLGTTGPVAGNVRFQDQRPPPELRLAGMDLITLPATRQPVTAGDFAFRAYSDGPAITVLRVSNRKSLFLNRLILVQSTVKVKDKTETRFALQTMWETRFRYSGKKDVPASDTDSLSYQSATGLPFLEPTLEIPGIDVGAAGLFDVAEVPTASADMRALFVAVNTGTTFVLHRIERHTDGFLDVSGDTLPLTPITPALAPGQPLTPLATLPPALSFYGEQDPARNAAGQEAELQRLGRLMLAMPVGDGGALKAAMAIFDYALDAEGRVVDLKPADQTAPLVDGTLSGGAFVPDTVSEVFPTVANIMAATAPRVTRMVLGQVQPQVSPNLYMGDDGLLHLYFGGPPPVEDGGIWTNLNLNAPEAMVAQYDTRITRLVLSAPWQLLQPSEEPPGKVYFNALLGGPAMTGATVGVLQTTFAGPAAADLRDVAISYPATLGIAAETWVGVSAEVGAFTAILNGQATDDPADPAAKSGQRAFFDFSGLRPLVRLPVTSPSGEAAAVQVVSALPDVALQGLTVTATGPTLSFAFSFRTAGHTAVTVTWAQVPATLAAYADLFDGIAAVKTYAYPPDPTATPLWVLDTDGAQARAPVLFCATAASVPVGLTLEVDAGAATDTVKLTITGGSGGTVILDGLPAEVTAFVAALIAAPSFTALRLEVLAGGAAGRILPTDSPQQRLTLAETSLLFQMLLPAVPLALYTPTPGTLVAGRQSHRYAAAGAHQPQTQMAAFVLSYDLPTSGIPAAVVITPSASPAANRSVHGPQAPDLHGALWRKRAPPRACSFVATDCVLVPTVSQGTAVGRVVNLRLQPRWTMEAWIKPQGSSQQQIVSYVDSTAAPPPGAPQMAYALGVKGQQVVTLPAYANFSGTDSSYFLTQTSPTANFYPTREFTWECWIQPQASPAPAGKTPEAVGVVFQYGPNPSAPQFAVGLSSDRRIHIQALDSFSSLKDFATTQPVAAVDTNGTPVWSHLALIGRIDAASGTWAIDVVLNGEKLQGFAGVPIIRKGQPALSIGGFSLNNSSMFGRIAQLRLWGFARTLAEIRRTWLITLGGTEFGLLGSWPMGVLETDQHNVLFVRNDAVASGPFWDATLFQSAKQPITMTDDSFFLSVLATVGGSPPVEAPALLRNGAWNHVALTYQAGGAVQMNPDQRRALGIYDWIEIEQSQSLDPGRAFAIDAWVIVPPTNNLPGALMSCWAEDTTVLEDSSFRLLVERDGSLTFEVAYVSDLQGTIAKAALTTSTLKLADGQVHHLAAVFSSTEQVVQAKGATTDATFTVTIWVDGVSETTGPTSVAGIASIQVNSTEGGSVLVGRAFLPPDDAEPVADECLLFFSGTLGELRFWSIAPDEQALFPERYPRTPRIGLPRGLSARWDFTEQGGFLAEDSVGDSNGILSTSAMWTGLAATSSMKVYANGGQIGSAHAFKGTFGAGTTDQFVMGAPSAGVAGITGAIGQIALYDSVRSAETINSQRFVPREGAERDLVACWDFTQDGKDITGGGNDSNPVIAPARIASSNAPISNEGPYVRNVYGGLVTDNSQSAPGRIAVGNFFAVTAPGTDDQAAVLLRQFVMEPGQSFNSPIQIGELEMTFIGQVQTDPTLIGYIEGAPPVPSENLTRPYYLSAHGTGYMKYLDTSTVTLTEESAAEVTYSSSSAAVTQVSLSGAIGALTAYQTGISAGSGFFNIEDDTFQFENRIQAQVKFSAELGTSRSTGLSSIWGVRQNYTMGLSGDWEGSPILNPTVGRRFLADNLGYALVESLTGDLYSVVFRATGASLGTIVLPNPDIPPDRNIILFPMKAVEGTKATTLDGKIGLMNDPAYPYADIQRCSFFRPAEAYATQHRIEFQEQRARAFAASFDAIGKGRTANADLGKAAENLAARSAAEPEESEDQTAPGALIPAQGMVSKFVWTADGGTYTEQHSYGARASRAYSGYNQVGGGAGLVAGGSFLLKIGVAWSFDFLATHTTRVETSKALDVSTAMSLSVSVAGEAFLKAWDETKQAFSAQAAPGKVKAYRFSTFYLPPSVSNGEKFSGIVDPIWKLMSNDPMARALRELKITNPVWRVFHRTTYVERLPPPAATGPNFASAPDLRPPVNIEGNLGLCRLVDVQLTQQGRRLDRLGVAKAVAAVMNPSPSGLGVYPASVLQTVVGWWADFLTSARPDAQGNVASPANALLLAGLQLSTVEYIYAGYVTGAIPEVLAGS